MTMRPLLTPPYAFRAIGSNGVMLVTQSGGSKVVLSASPKGTLQTRDEGGWLVDLTEDHPTAKFIERACNYHDHMRVLLQAYLNGEASDLEAKELLQELEAEAND